MLFVYTYLFSLLETQTHTFYCMPKCHISQSSRVVFATWSSCHLVFVGANDCVKGSKRVFVSGVVCWCLFPPPP